MPRYKKSLTIERKAKVTGGEVTPEIQKLQKAYPDLKIVGHQDNSVAAIEIEVYRDSSKKGFYRVGFVWRINGETLGDNYTRRGNCLEAAQNMIRTVKKGGFKTIIVPAGQKRPSVIRKEQRKQRKKIKSS